MSLSRRGAMEIKNVKLLCPKCGSENVAEVVYGYFPQPIAGRVIYGGCCVPIKPADWGCFECGYQWSQKIKVSNPQKAGEEKDTRPLMICPKCYSLNVLEIVYGTYDEPLDRPVIYGGGCIPENAPNRSCEDCGYRWRQK
jgi:hypothetical protein